MKARRKALAHLKAIQRYRQLLQRGYKPKRAARSVMRHHRFSRATLSRNLAKVRGAPERFWLIRLWPKWISRGPAEMPPEAWAMLREDYLGPKRLSAARCIRRLRHVATALSWRIPSERTLQRQIKVELDPLLRWRTPGHPRS